MDQPVSGWSTISEVRFLEALGRAAPACARIGRAELLRRYIAALDRRVTWGSMDVAEIDRVAKLALRQAEERNADLSRRVPLHNVDLTGEPLAASPAEPKA